MQVFKEKQYFRKKITFLILIAVSLLSMYAAYNYTRKHTIDGENVLQIVVFILPVAVAFLISKLSLRTRIDEHGIQYQFFPFHLSYKQLKWSEISTCFVRKYRPIAEYGGWGFRISLFRKRGNAFSVSGKIGLQIELKNGKKLLIGTQKKKELERVLQTYARKLVKGCS